MSHPGRGASEPVPLGSWHALVRSFGALAAGEGFARLLGAIAVITMARRLDPDAFGLVTLGTALVGWFSLVADSGTEVLNVREVARRPDRIRQIAEPVLGLRLALSAIAVAAFLGISALVADNTSDRRVLWLFALALPAVALNLRWIVLGVRAAKAVAAGNSLSQLLFVAGILLFVSARQDTGEVPLARAAGELAYALVVLLAVARRFGPFRPRFDLASWRSTLSDSLPLFVNGIARAIVYSFPVLALAIMATDEEVGFYGAASRPALFFAGIIGLFSTSFLASYSAAGGERAHIFGRSTQLAVVLALLIAVAVSVTSGNIVSLIYGDRYSAAAGALAILVWMVPIAGLGSGYASSLIAGDRQRTLMLNSLGGAVFNVAASLGGVSLGGIEGAAAATLGSQLVTFSLNYTSSVRHALAPSLSVALRRPGAY